MAKPTKPTMPNGSPKLVSASDAVAETLAAETSAAAAAVQQGVAAVLAPAEAAPAPVPFAAATVAAAPAVQAPPAPASLSAPAAKTAETVMNSSAKAAETVMTSSAQAAEALTNSAAAVAGRVTSSAAAAAGALPDSTPAAVTAGMAARTIATSAAQTRTAMEMSMDQITRGTEGFYKATEEAVEFGRGNIEALTKATQTYMTGLQDLSKQTFSMMQALSEQAVQNAKALATVKSLKEAAEMQATFAKTQLEKSMAEATRLNEAAFKLAEQSSAPIAARMTLAMERMGRPTAAI